MTEGYRPTWVEVDSGPIRENARILKPEAAELMAVVKANGYGHGDVEVARAAHRRRRHMGRPSRWSRKG